MDALLKLQGVSSIADVKKICQCMIRWDVISHLTNVEELHLSITGQFSEENWDLDHILDTLKT